MNLEVTSNLILQLGKIFQNELTKLIQTWGNKEDMKYTNSYFTLKKCKIMSHLEDIKMLPEFFQG